MICEEYTNDESSVYKKCWEELVSYFPFIGLGILKEEHNDRGGDLQSHRQQGNLTSLLLFF
jgi:hypothetical protein